MRIMQGRPEMRSRTLSAVATLLLGSGLAVVPLSASQAAAGHNMTGAALTSASTSAPQLGVDLYAGTAYSLADATSWGRSDVKYLHDTLKAQSVGIVWNLNSPSDSSDTVRALAKQTLSPASVAELTHLAESAGMTVQYRPIIRVGPVADWNDSAKSWEGYIYPKNQKAWFGSLYKAQLPYLKIAQERHIRQFVVGTELHALTTSKWWPWFLKKVSAVYHGIVTYSANWSLFYPGQSLPPVHVMGVDAYPVLNVSNSASQEKVTKAWEANFSQRHLPLALLHRTSMDEISIPAVKGAYQDPANWNASGASDPQIQVRYFRAACATAAHYHMLGLYFFELPLTPDPATPMSFPAFFAGKPGGQAIASCIQILKSSPSADS